MKNRSIALFACCTVLLLTAAGVQAARETHFDITTASLLGGSGLTDRIRGIRIQPDGTIALAANISLTQTGSISPVLLNNASAATGGAIMRLSSDGRQLLSITRLAAQVEDLDSDAAGNLFVAAWNDGVFKLNPAADQVLWQRPGRVMRVDAAGAGTSAALTTTATDPSASNPGSGSVTVYAADGTALGSAAGRHNTLDVCLHDTSSTVITIGWRQASVGGVPVQIAYLRGSEYAGVDKWLDYDWSTDSTSPAFINKPANNMADTRGYRCAIGQDSRLYAAYEAAGGNHIFRYAPRDIMTAQAIVGGDQWHTFSNTKSEHKTVFARYDPATGDVLAMQQFVARLGADKGHAGNALRVYRGAIMADATGRVFLGGESAWGLPLPPHPRYVDSPAQQVFNHLQSDASAYLGGAYLAVFSPDFKTREYLTRLSESGATMAIDFRQSTATGDTLVFGGLTAGSSLTRTYTINPLPLAAGGEQDGWFAVINSGPPPATVTPDTTLTQKIYLPVAIR